MRPKLMTRTGTLLISLVLGASACAGSDAASPSTVEPNPPATTEPASTDAPVPTDPIQTDPPSTTEPAESDPDDPLDVQFDSEPVEAGPLFGSAGGDQAAEAEASPEAPTCDEDSAPDCGETATPPAVVDDFVPAAIDAPFCSLLDDLSERPFPSDDTEAAEVARVWFGQLQLVAVDSVAGDMGILIEFIDDALASGEADFDSLSPATDAAIDRLNTYVDAACEGLGSDSTQPVDPDLAVTEPVATVTPGADPLLPDGLVIPVIDFDGEIYDGAIPIFGSGDADKASGFEPAATDVGFCTALDIVNSRPIPDDDFGQVVVADQYLLAIRPLVPEAIATEFDALQAWTAQFADVGEFTEQIEQEFLGEGIDEAADVIDNYVDDNCNGL